MSARRITLLAIPVAITLLGTACGGSDAEKVSSTRDTTTTTAAAGTATTTAGGGGSTPSGTVAANASGVNVDVTFVRGEKVGTAHRRVAPTQAVGKAALEQLLAGPTAAERAAGLGTAVPAGTRLLGLDIANGTATVDLSQELVSGGGSLSMRERLAQVVFTLTQFPSVERVAFRVAGTPTTVFGGEGVMLDPQVDRSDFADTTPLIFLESVAPGDTIATPVKVAGMSNTFEANVRIRVLGADGSVLADTFTTATSGSGTWGTFAVNVPFAKGAQTTGTVVLFETSPKDGSMVNVVEVPVRFS
jgi:spore germination protein GerM